MKQILSIAFVLFASIVALADGPFETTININQFEAYTAKAASIEPINDWVAIFLTSPKPGKQTGLMLDIKSDAKFIAVRATQQNSTKQLKVSKRQTGEYFFFGLPGRYSITVIESDPEKGINFNDLEAEIIGENPTDPDLPTEPVPGDFEALSKVAAASAKALNDSSTSKSLAAAYREALRLTKPENTLAEVKVIVTTARKAALLNRESFNADWNSFLIAVDAELVKVAVDVASYKKAIETIASAIEK